MSRFPRYYVGQIVSHKKLGYRGVVVDVDAAFVLKSSWKHEVALSRAQERPWYHILVDQAQQETYVAEHCLELDETSGEVVNTGLSNYFSGYLNGRYQLKQHAH
jgi:heat shock protein HspQ